MCAGPWPPEGERRASSRPALDRGCPARPRVALPAAQKPHDGQPGRDHLASVQPCSQLPGSPLRQCPGPYRGSPGCSGHPRSPTPRCTQSRSNPWAHGAARPRDNSPPGARGAAASLGSWPGSLNLLFSSEPPGRLDVEICCKVAYHPGFAGACSSALRPAPCARCGAPGLLCRLVPGQVSVRRSFELEASVCVDLKRVHLEVART